MRRLWWLIAMRHIALSSYVDGPCNGTIEMKALSQPAAPRLSLPILGAAPMDAPRGCWAS